MWKRIAHLIETEVDDVKYGVERLAGLQKPLQIKCYNGYGNRDFVRIGGRVLVQADLPKTGASDSAWKNFLNSSRNWFTDEVPGAKLQAAFQNSIIDIVADEEGYFLEEISFDPPGSGSELWAEVELTLLDPVDEMPVTARAVAQVPGAGCEFGVISDIDDTVMHTGATDILSMAKNTLLGNAHTRVVFNGASALYAALARGIDGRGRNPFFYVTSSPWNLYDLITQVFEIRNIPRGTLFMKDWGIDEDKFIKSGHHTHKKKAITDVLEFYPKMKFILIGDSGQEDPEIYTDVLSEFPDRILAIYIRDVTKVDRDAAVKALAEKAREQNVDLILTEESYALAEHAVEKGFIRKSELPAVAGQQQADREEAVEDGADPLD